MPRTEPDRRRRRTAHLLREPVVATAAADRVLGGVERAARELEDGARVVVESAHQARRDLERDSERLQSFLHALEVRGRCVTQVLAQLRRALEHVGPVVALRVENAQGVRLGPLHLVAEQSGVVVPVREQDLAVALTGRRVAHRVDEQAHVVQTEVAAKAPQQLDDLDVDVRIVDPDHLRAELPVLAIAAGLRSFCPEVRREIPDLPRRGRTVLHERAHDRCRALRAQCEPPTTSIDELVHLLAYDVGGLTNPGEHLVVLDDRRQQQPVPETFGPLREARHDLDPTRRFRRQDVEHAFGRAHDVTIRRHARHASQHRRRDS